MWPAMACGSSSRLSCVPCGAPSCFPAGSSCDALRLAHLRSSLPLICVAAADASSSHVAAEDGHRSTLAEQHLHPPLANSYLPSLPQEAPAARRKPPLINRLAVKKRNVIPATPPSENLSEALRLLHGADDDFEAIACAFNAWNGLLSCRDAVAILNQELNLKKAFAFFQWLKSSDAISPNVYLYNVLLKLVRRDGKWNQALELMQEMEQEGIKPDNITYSTIISFAARCKLVEEAFKWYERMQDAGCTPDGVTHSTMINAYVEAGRVKEASEVYANLRRQGFRLDNPTCSTIMKLHAMQGNVGAVLDIYEEMKREKIIPNAVTFNCIIRILFKAGKIQQIFKLFEEMQAFRVKPSEVTVSLLFRVYGKAGKVDDAFKLFSAMKEEGIEIDTVAYNSLLSLCAETGLVEEGESILKELLQSKKHLPDSWTWSTMVEMYAKAGKMNDAKKSLKNISNASFEPDIIAYTSLIRGYSNLKDFKGVGAVFDELLTARLPFDEILVGTLMQMLPDCEGEEDTAIVLCCIEKARPRLRKAIDMLMNEHFFFASWKEEFTSFINETPSNSRMVYCNLLMNLCWAKSLGERSYQIMGWAISFGIYPDLQRKNFIEWSLNLRFLSFGAARTALHVWFRSLSHTLQQGEELPSVLVIDTGTVRSRTQETPLNAFVMSQLEEMCAPFEESGYRGGQYTATGESVKRWLHSETSHRRTPFLEWL